MTENNPFSEAQIKNLKDFLDNNPNVEFAQTDLSNADIVAAFDWQKLKKPNDEILNTLRAYQRLKKIMPELDQKTALSLLRAGIHSALQIAATPKARFLHDHASLFGDDPAVVEQFYNQALAIRSQILLQYMEVKQTNEPHVRTARIQ